VNVVNLADLYKIIGDESKVFEYFLSKIDLSCKYCKSKSVRRIRRNKIKCYSCKREFSILKNTCFGKMKLSVSKWLMIIKLFELSVSAREAGKQYLMNQ